MDSSHAASLPAHREQGSSSSYLTPHQSQQQYLSPEIQQIIYDTVTSVDPLYAILRTVRKKVYSGERGPELLAQTVAVEHELKSAVHYRFDKLFSRTQDAGANYKYRTMDGNHQHAIVSSSASVHQPSSGRDAANHHSVRDYYTRREERDGNGYTPRDNTTYENALSRPAYASRTSTMDDYRGQAYEHRERSNSPHHTNRSRSPQRSSSSRHSRSRSRGRDQERYNQPALEESQLQERRAHHDQASSATQMQANAAAEEQQISISQDIPDGTAKNAIRIFNLPPTIDEQYVREICRNYGKVVRVRMATANESTPSHAVVAYFDVEPATQARKLLDGWKLFGHTLLVRYNIITESTTRDVRLKDGTVVPPAAKSRPFHRGPVDYNGRRHIDSDGSIDESIAVR